MTNRCPAAVHIDNTARPQIVDKKINWVHFDLMAWNLTSRPGFPKGGEAMSLRTVFKTINEMFN